MLTHPAALLNIPLLILDKGEYTPAKQTLLAPTSLAHPDGPFTSEPHIRELAAACDVLTVEIEHVNADVLEAVEKEGLCEVQPSPATIRLIQDKYLQKKYLAERGIPVAPFAVVEQSTEANVKAVAGELGLPVMLKARTLAYDGRGNSPLKSTDSAAINKSLEFLGDRPLYAEGWVPFVKEVAVMVVRNKAGEVRSYDAVETIHRDSILRVCLAPLRSGTAPGAEVDTGVNDKARQLAEKAVATLDGAGIFGVEMFLLEDGELGGDLGWDQLTRQARSSSTRLLLVPTTRATTPSRRATSRSSRTTSVPSCPCPSATRPSASPRPPWSTCLA